MQRKSNKNSTSFVDPKICMDVQRVKNSRDISECFALSDIKTYEAVLDSTVW